MRYVRISLWCPFRQSRSQSSPVCSRRHLLFVSRGSFIAPDSTPASDALRPASISECKRHIRTSTRLSYLHIVLFQKLQDAFVVFEGDLLSLRESLKRRHVPPAG